MFKSEPVLKKIAQNTPGDETDERYSAAELGLEVPPLQTPERITNAALSPAARSLVPEPDSPEAPDA